MIRVMLADDQHLVRGALAALLALEDDIDVVAEVGRGDEVVTAALANEPDVALLDVEMPGLDGLAVTAALAEAAPKVKVLILTTFGRPGYLRRAMEGGALGFLVCWYVTFVLLYAATTAMAHPRFVVVDRVASAAIHSAAGFVFFAVATTVVYTFWRGHSALGHLNFFTHDMAGVRPTSPLSSGGVMHAIVGTLIEIGIGVSVALPLGIGAAVFMTEVGGAFAKVTRTVIDAMTALPDIVAGLFILAFWLLLLGFSYSGFACALALSILMMPTVVRAAEEMLKLVPSDLREASYALGVPRL